MPPKPPMKRGPKNATRKSKEERDELEAQEQERRRSRQAQAEADARDAEAKRRQYLGINDNSQGRNDKNKGRPAPRSVGDGRSGRGGFMRSSLSGVAGGSSRAAAAARSGAPDYVRVKRERDGDPFKTDASDTEAGWSNFNPSTNIPDDLYGVESDDDESNRYRIDVQGLKKEEVEEMIVLSDDENSDGGFRPRSSSTGPRSVVFPIRVGRREHKDRTMGINTEASTAATQDIKRQAEAANEASGGRRRKGSKGASEKAPGQAVFHGVYKDDEDSIKPDPSASAASGSGKTAEEATTKAASKEKRKSSGRRRAVTPPPQTEEEALERRIRKAEMAAMREELGPRMIVEKNSDDEEVEVDEQMRLRDSAVYLIQLPPVMPQLMDPNEKVKAEQADTEASKAADDAKAKDTAKNRSGDEETILKTDAEDAKPKGNMRQPSGHVGKLRVHRSGKTTLSWGGVSMEMKQGMDAYFLQQVVMTDTSQPTPGSSEPPNNRAFSFASVRGKFVVTPDLNELLKKKN